MKSFPVTPSPPMSTALKYYLIIQMFICLAGILIALSDDYTIKLIAYTLITLILSILGWGVLQMSFIVKFGHVGVGSLQYSGKEQRNMKTLELDPKDANAWNTLGSVGGGRVGGLQYSGKDCYVKALELDPKNATSWYNFGIAVGGSFEGYQYSGKDCFVKTIELDPKYANIWSNFGTMGGGRVGDLQYSAKDCFIKALELDPKYAVAWSKLGTVGG